MKFPYRFAVTNAATTLCLLFFAFACSGSNSGWKGTIGIEDGVTVVKNPKEPRYGPGAVSLIEDLSIGEPGGREEVVFARIRDIAVSEAGDIFVLDAKAQMVMVFNEEGEYVNSFGRFGQGPGEFQYPQILSFTDAGELYVGDLNRFSFFSQSGEFLRGIPMESPRLMTPELDSAGNILGIVVVRDREVYELQKFDAQLEYVSSFDSSPLPSVDLRRTGKRNPLFSSLLWHIGPDDRVICGWPGRGYRLHIYDADARLVRRIEKDYDPVAVSEEKARKAVEEYPEEMRREMEVPSHFPPFSWLTSDDSGRIYVLTHETTLTEGERIFDVFDREGMCILKLVLPGIPRVIKNDRLYLTVTDEEGYPYIRRYRVRWAFDRP